MAITAERSIVVVDTETTGMDEEARVVEFAMAHLRLPLMLRHWMIFSTASSLVNPGVPIPANTSAIHTITDDMVKDAPELPDAFHDVFPFPIDIDHGQFVVAAHNAQFDRKYLPMLSHATWLCTWRCAAHMYPDSPSASNMTLRYYLKLPVPDGFSHRAAYDTRVTAALLMRMLETKTLDELLELQHKPILHKTCKFGVHFGKPWNELPRDYLQWILRAEFDDDTRYTAQYWLDQ